MFDAIKNLFVDKEPAKPATFEEAVEFVANRIEADTVNNPHFHFSGGMALRNYLGLWDKNSPLHKHMVERFGLCHADDTGALIAHAANARRNSMPYTPDVDIAIFKTHWRNMGLDPATMEPLKDNS